MKNLVFGLALASSAFASEEIKVEQDARMFQVNSASYSIVGEQGWPQTEVKVTATFGNECMVPHEDELIKMVEYSQKLEHLKIHVGETADRACPAVYRPTTVTLNLGVFTKPNDGLFSSIRVNGKLARKAN